MLLRHYNPCEDCSNSCNYCHHIRAYRSHGSNIPDNCQGCIFPGDEAHCECTLTGEYCNPEDVEMCPKLREELKEDEEED